MKRLLSIAAMIAGAICVAIALAHIILGPRAIVGGFFVNPTMDSEDRFYAVFFLFWGVAMIYCSRDLRARQGLFGALLFTFFLGGVARIISALTVGLPNTTFIFLGSLELGLPPLFWWWYRSTMSGKAR
jgi:Domain of unknown function (DUF4345)